MHAVEHMLYRSPEGEDFKIATYKLTGREVDAVTTPEFVLFRNRLPANNFNVFIEAWARQATSTYISDEDFELERQIIINEISNYEIPGTYGHWAISFLQTVLFPESPLGNSAAGTIASINSLTPVEVSAYKQAHMNASNTIITIVGGITLEDAIESLQFNFGDLPAGQVRSQKLPYVPPQVTGQFKYSDGWVDDNTLAYVMQMPGSDHPDFLPAYALFEYLAGGTGSPMFREIRENRGLAYIVGDDFFLTDESGFPLPSINNMPRSLIAKRFDEDKTDEIRGIIEKEICKVMKNQLDLGWLNAIKSGIMMRFYEHKLENPYTQAAIIDEMEGGIRPYTVMQEMDFWRNLMPRDIVETARRYLQRPFSVVALFPSVNEPEPVNA